MSQSPMLKARLDAMRDKTTTDLVAELGEIRHHINTSLAYEKLLEQAVVQRLHSLNETEASGGGCTATLIPGKPDRIHTTTPAGSKNNSML